MSRVIIETEVGSFSFLMLEARAPATCAHFLSVILSGAFEDASVFRIVAPQNHQADDPNPIEVVQLGPRGCIESQHDPVPHENTDQTGLRHVRGTVSAARVELNYLFGSFFVCMRDEPALDFGAGRNPDRQGFAAFGQVDSGFETLKRIMACAESSDFLTRDIRILSATVEMSETPSER